MDVAPYNKEGRTYIPVRYVADTLGVTEDNIVWNSVSRKVFITKNSIGVQLQEGSNNLLVDGKIMKMDVTPALKNGRMMLPIRYVTEAFGSAIFWDQGQQLIRIEKE